MELMNKYGIRITRAVGTDDADLILCMNGEHYAITNTETFPSIFDGDDVEFVKSNPYGQIYFYDDEDNIIE